MSLSFIPITPRRFYVRCVINYRHIVVYTWESGNYLKINTHTPTGIAKHETTKAPVSLLPGLIAKLIPHSLYSFEIAIVYTKCALINRCHSLVTAVF